MKLKKSRVSLMLALAMLFTIMGSSMVSAETLDYSLALTRLQGLGIIDSSVTDSNKIVTRGEFIKSIVIAEGLSNTAKHSKGTTIFPDIDPNSELSGYINAGINLGIKQGVNQGVVYGTPNGTFQAEKAVSYGEACTMMVRLLGYKDSDEELQTSSWPSNYIQEASTLELTEGIILNKNDKLTVGVEAIMLDRLFNSVMKKSSSTESDKFFSDNYYSDTTVTGKLVETLILGNSKTSDNLSENQILTDTGSYTLKRGVTVPEIGGKYKLYADGTVITKVSPKENTLVNYAVSGVSDSSITYTDDNGSSQAMSLPQASAYYYHGVNIDYDAAVKAIQPYSSIILAKDSNGNNDYIVIIDPTYSKPLIYSYEAEKIKDLMKSTKYEYINKNGDKIDSDSNLEDGDVVYFVSDLWGRNSFMYVNNTVIYGTIASIAPSKFSPTSVVVTRTIENGSSSSTTKTTISTGDEATTTTTTTSNSSVSNVSSTYTFSEYFNRTRLTDDESSSLLNIDDQLNFVLGIDGKIVDIYK